MERLNTWLGTITNIGVILGLLLVAYQINQTNEEMHQDATSMMVDTWVAGDELMGELMLRIAESPELGSLWRKGNTGEPLTDDEAVRYQMLAEQVFRRFRTLSATWNAHGQNRGGWAKNQLIFWLQNNPGLLAAYQKFREKNRISMALGFAQTPSEGEIYLSGNFFETVENAVLTTGTNSQAR